MNHRGPVRVQDRHAFDTLIDARSPAEFALDHLPGAINCPVLDDEERRIVGTLYKQQGAFEARRVGGAMVAANLARHLREQFADKPAAWKPLVYCWRGGMRSGSMVTWLRMVGWDAQQLAGGYKSWRRHVIDRIDALAPQLLLRVLCGPTGSAKTRVLQALAARGAQVLDLEAYARHRGSVLGAWPGVAQPSQTAFETLLAQALEPLDVQRPIFVEAESSRIGRVAVPQALVKRLRASPCIEIQATPSSTPGISAARLCQPGRRPGGPGNTVGHPARVAWQAGHRPLASLGHGGRTGTPVCRTDGLALRPALHPVAKRTLVPVAAAADRTDGGFVAQRH